MERFCDKCGSLVSGNGKFCPLCGAKMGFELNISSDLDIDTSSSFLDDLDTSLPDIEVDTKGTEKIEKAAEASLPATDTPDTIYTNMSAQKYVPQGYVPQYMPQQSYSRVYQQNGTGQNADTEKLTMGQWVGTLLLSTCLGIVSFILLIMWGFGATAKEPRKSYARAMLVLLPIVHIVAFFSTAILFYLMDS